MADERPNDLLTRRAGESAREQADALGAARPFHTRLARLLSVHTDERAYRLGAVGEETVGARLDKLDPQKWLVLHDIILSESGTNLDHLVVGPPGVFSLNTKHHPKKKAVVTEKGFRLNGYRTNYLPVAASEAHKVARLLGTAFGHEVYVRPVIVVMGAELEVRSAPSDVSVIRRRDLPKWFKKLPEIHTQPEVDELRRVATEPLTWRPRLTVTSWSKYGKKRLYVNDTEGRTLGYRDELTGDIHPNDPNDLERMQRSLRANR